MHLKNRPPVFVPDSVLGEMEKCSKAALMDMVWDYAVQIAAYNIPTHDARGPLASGPGVDAALAEFRSRREVILRNRQA
jgi:hypothetical protein